MKKIAPNFVEAFIATISSDRFKNDPKIQDLKQKYEAGTISIVEHTIYSNVEASGKTEVEFFLTDHQKALGLRNVAAARLDEDQFFVPVVAQILAGDLGAAPTDTLLRNEPYTDIFAAGGNLNSAEFDLIVNANEVLMKETSVAGFITTDSSLYKGAKVLDRTTVLKPNLRISAKLKTGNPIAANLAVAFRMHGVITIPKQA